MSNLEKSDMPIDSTCNKKTIREDAKRKLGVLQQKNEKLFQQALQDVFKSLDEYASYNFNSVNGAQGMIVFAVRRALLEHGFSNEDLNSIKKIDNILIQNGISPTETSISIRKNKKGGYFWSGNISKLTCTKSVNTNEYLPASLPWGITTKVYYYEEILYTLPKLHSVTYGTFNKYTNRVDIYSGVIRKIHSKLNALEQESLIKVVTANELWHMYFHKVIVPKFWINENTLFNYQWSKYTFTQVSELWSDYISLSKAFEEVKQSWDYKIPEAEFIRIREWWKYSNRYILTSKFWSEIGELE